RRIRRMAFRRTFHVSAANQERSMGLRIEVRSCWPAPIRRWGPRLMSRAWSASRGDLRREYNQLARPVFEECRTPKGRASRRARVCGPRRGQMDRKVANEGRGEQSGASIDKLCIDTIRTLSMDAVQKAISGHPGAPMALAPVAYTLWRQFLRYDPDAPD